MKNTVVVLLVTMLTIMSMVLVGCKSSAELTIPIGLNAELTGGLPIVGASCKNAALLAVKEVNDAGGLDVGGKKYQIKLFIEDNAYKSDQSVAVTQKLITQDNVVAIIGPNASAMAIPPSEIAETSKVLMISPWSTNPATTIDSKTGQPKKYVFRACFIDTFQGKLDAKFAMETLGAKRIAVMYDVADDAGVGLSKYFKETVEQMGGNIVAFETYTSGDKDFSGQLTKIKQAHALGITAKFLGSDGWASDELIKLGGKDVEGTFHTAHYAPDIATPIAQNFIKAYNTAYSSVPDDVAALTYDSFGMLFESLKTAGKVDRQAVRDALANMAHYEGVTGTLQFKEGSGDPIKSAVILETKNGKFVYYATVQP